jgi:hypothetical protein
VRVRCSFATILTHVPSKTLVLQHHCYKSNTQWVNSKVMRAHRIFRIVLGRTSLVIGPAEYCTRQSSPLVSNQPIEVGWHASPVHPLQAGKFSTTSCRECEGSNNVPINGSMCSQSTFKLLCLEERVLL